MAMTTAVARAWVARYRVQSEAVAVALLAVVLFLWLGVEARRSLQPLRADLTRLSLASSEIASFRSAFKAAAPEQDLQIGRLAEPSSIVVSRDNRVALAQQIAARAESLGLSDVRVRFAPADSAATPPRPELMGSSVGIADYSLTVDCAGRFGAVLSLVRLLPPSVAVQRLIGENAAGRTQFHLGLAIFESADAPAPAPAGSP